MGVGKAHVLPQTLTSEAVLRESRHRSSHKPFRSDSGLYEALLHNRETEREREGGHGPHVRCICPWTPSPRAWDHVCARQPGPMRCA